MLITQQGIGEGFISFNQITHFSFKQAVRKIILAKFKVLLNIFSCPEIIWSWFIPLDLCMVNLSAVMPWAQHSIMEFFNRFAWVCVCFGSFPPTVHLSWWRRRNVTNITLQNVAKAVCCHLFPVPSYRSCLCHCCSCCWLRACLLWQRGRETSPLLSPRGSQAVMRLPGAAEA